MATSGPLDPGKPTDCHPYYSRRYRRWRKNRAAYIGGDEWYGQGDTYQLGPFTIAAATPGKTGPGQVSLWNQTEQNRLWPHEREKDYRYARRLRMSVYENVFGPQVNTVAATIAKACRKVEWPAGLEYLDKDWDRWGMDCATARIQRIAWAHVNGHVYTLIEKPEAGPQPSRMHELQAGIRAYCCLLTPLDLLDWSWDAEEAVFRWALIQVRRPADRVSPDERTEKQPETHAWTKLYKAGAKDAAGNVGPGLWILYRDGVEVERGEAPPFVPIVVQFAIGQDPDQCEPVGIPINDDVVDLAELRFNKHSWLTDQQAANCFNQLVLDMDAPDAETERALGVHNYIGAKSAEYLAPNVAPMDHLSASMDRDAASMRQMQGIETKGEASQAAKSGVALQLEQQNMSSLFASYAAAAEAGELAIVRMAAMLEGADPEAAMVQYVRDFSALDAAARFGTLTSALGIVDGFKGEARAELLKQVFLAAHPDIEPEARDRIFAEIDAEVQAAKEASEAARASLKMAADRLASGEPPPDDGEDEEQDDMPKPGRPMPMAAKDDEEAA